MCPSDWGRRSSTAECTTACAAGPSPRPRPCFPASPTSKRRQTLRRSIAAGRGEKERLQIAWGSFQVSPRGRSLFQKELAAVEQNPEDVGQRLGLALLLLVIVGCLDLLSAAGLDVANHAAQL